ncbi:unnamed protein product [Brassicogethes aeneus]|uniref:Uncharacterized protein n=1 Tax=Brassicogethes aeneus TaxID=1431903 RepID=A0A9P0AYE7_BRAAE|nr:unnamed protein product [Brassicogethes aeneus]
MNEDNVSDKWKLNVLPKLKRMKEEAYENRLKMKETKKLESKQKRKKNAIELKSSSVIKIRLKENKNKKKCVITKVDEKSSDTKNTNEATNNKKGEEKKKKKANKRGQNMTQAMIDAQRQKWKEKKRKYRERVAADLERSEKAKSYERERNKKRKEKGQLKNIGDMENREKNKQRKKWREASNRYYQKKKLSGRTEKFINDNTPPSSPLSLEENINYRIVEISSRRQQAGRRRQKQNTERKRQEVLALKKKLYLTNMKMEKWKRKYHRVVNTRKTSPSSRKEVDNLIKQGDTENLS